MTGTEYWIEKIPPTYLYLAIFAVQVLILLSFCCMIFTNRDILTELVVLQSREYGLSVSREEVSQCIAIFSVIAITVIIVEIILWSVRIICSKSEVIKR